MAMLLQLHLNPDNPHNLAQESRIVKALRGRIWTMIYFFDKRI